MSETNEHLEQAEHAGHGADPFTLRVAMTMAIIAAVLAAIALVGHRKHNEALQKQGDANRLLTEAAAKKVEESNIRAWYQSKRARVDDAAKSLTSSKLYALAPGSDAILEQATKEWEAYRKKNSTKPNEIKLDDQGFPAKMEDGSDNDTLGALIVKGNKLNEQGQEKIKAAEEVQHEYEHVHHQADGLDWAHLSVELGLVLCTICILTKRREYWLTGIGAALVGVGFAMNALLN